MTGKKLGNARVNKAGCTENGERTRDGFTSGGMSFPLISCNRTSGIRRGGCSRQSQWEQQTFPPSSWMDLVIQAINWPHYQTTAPDHTVLTRTGLHNILKCFQLLQRGKTLFDLNKLGNWVDEMHWSCASGAYCSDTLHRFKGPACCQTKKRTFSTLSWTSYCFRRCTF